MKLLSGCCSEVVQFQVEKQKTPADLVIVTGNQVDLPQLLTVLDEVIVETLFDTVTERCFISYSIYITYFR